jgi:hypothetical protein
VDGEQHVGKSFDLERLATESRRALLGLSRRHQRSHIAVIAFDAAEVSLPFEM